MKGILIFGTAVVIAASPGLLSPGFRAGPALPTLASTLQGASSAP